MAQSQDQELLGFPVNLGDGDTPVTKSELNDTLNKLKWQWSQLNFKSGMTQYLTGSPGYFIGFTKNISGIKDNTPVFSVGNPSGAYFAYNGTNLFLEGGTLLIDSTGSPFSVAYGVQNGTCTDGNAVTFPQSYSQPPVVIIGGGGVTYSSAQGSAATQWQTLQAQNITTTGFTPYLKIQSGGSQNGQTINFGGLPATSTQATLNTTVAYDNNYTFNFAFQIPGGNQYTETVTLSYSANGSNPFTTLQMIQKTNLGSTTATYSFNRTFNISGLSASTSKLQISMTNSSGSSHINTGATATYTSGSPGTLASATPAGVSPIPWISIGVSV